MKCTFLENFIGLVWGTHTVQPKKAFETAIQATQSPSRLEQSKKIVDEQLRIARDYGFDLTESDFRNYDAPDYKTPRWHLYSMMEKLKNTINTRVADYNRLGKGQHKLIDTYVGNYDLLTTEGQVDLRAVIKQDYTTLLSRYEKGMNALKAMGLTTIRWKVNVLRTIALLAVASASALGLAGYSKAKDPV